MSPINIWKGAAIAGIVGEPVVQPTTFRDTHIQIAASRVRC